MWLTILNLILISLVPIGAAVGMKLLMKYTKFTKLGYWWQQLIIGLVFGGVSILGTIMGVVTTSGAIINVRDVGPIIAGFIFGGPAGILAGVIGGAHRLISAYLGFSGMYTRFACSIATVCAGLITAIIRKFVFSGHQGKWYYGLGLGVLIESFHMLLVFLTHMDDIETAYYAVLNCALPMIIANSLAVMVAIIICGIISGEKVFESYRPSKISTIIQSMLLGSLAVAYFIISLFTYSTLDNINQKSTNTLLQTAVEDVKKDVDEQIDRELLTITVLIQEQVNNAILDEEDIDTVLETIADEYGISEVSIVSEDSIIVKSTNPAVVNYDMNSGKQSMEFNCLLWDTEYFIQSYQEISLDNSTKMKYFGAALKNNKYNYGYIQLGLNSEVFHDVLDTIVVYSVHNRHVGNSGFLVISDEYGNIISKHTSFELDTVYDLGYLKLNETDVYELELEGDVFDIYYYMVYLEGFYIIAGARKAACDLDTNIAFMTVQLSSAVIFLTMFCVMYILIKRHVVNSVENINDSLDKISEGDLNVNVEERKTYEFNSLSNDINKTVSTLKGFIEREAKKIDDELAFAKSIQSASLPQTFPAFPDLKQIDLFALMQTAKEVGGDFYDFYRLDEDRIAILIADVSGKGIPAAMFMMKAKSVIKSLALTNLSVEEVFNQANKILCEGNDAQMFVTAWLGFVNIKTGHVEYANAGHNPPLIKLNGKFEYLKCKPGFVLAGLDIARYRKEEFDLKAGDGIYLYTDGVTEATNKESKLYGESRLEAFLNTYEYTSAYMLAEDVLENVHKFTVGEPQSDDITMLYLHFNEEEK